MIMEYKIKSMNGNKSCIRKEKTMNNIIIKNNQQEQDFNVDIYL